MTKPKKITPQDQALINDQKLLEEITCQRMDTQRQFDTVKMTIATAGLLVALNLGDSWTNKEVTLLGLPAYTLTLLLILFSMAVIVIGSWVSEIMLKSLEKFIANTGISRKVWLGISKTVSQRSAERISAIYRALHVSIPSTMISLLNHLTTILLLSAICVFGYLVYLSV